MNADGSNIHPLVTSPRPTDADLEYASNAYSADGRRIFYQSWTQGGVQPDGCCQLWVMDADGSNQHQFPGSRLVNSWEGVAAVSPDGQWVAFWRVINERPTQRISVVRADGSGFVIQTGPELNGLASWGWAPDSSKILMAPQDDVDPARQYILDPSGGPWTESAWETRAAPDWQRMAP
jgi:Tol biopolymer transport system component